MTPAATFRSLPSSRWRAVGWHLCASVLVAGLVAWLVFGVWFPYPYRELSGGRDLFVMIVGIDVVCGPLLTLVLFNPRKSRRELFIDLSLVVAVQLAALAYGTYTMNRARPVLLAFEADRFRVVGAAEIDPERVNDAPAELRNLPWTGPRLIGVRIPKPTDADFSRSVDLGLAGLDVTFRPSFWRPYDEQRSAVLAKAKPLTLLRKLHPGQADAISEAVQRSGFTEDQLLFLPLVSRRTDAWVVLVRASNAEVAAYAPVDGF
ncbi:MAG: hypothetical protein RJA98_3341 [Pseudomonadota bacterium]